MRKHTAVPNITNTSGIKFYSSYPCKVKVKKNGNIYIYDSMFYEVKVTHNYEILYVYRGRNELKAKELATKVSEIIDESGIDGFLKWYYENKRR